MNRLLFIMPFWACAAFAQASTAAAAPAVTLTPATKLEGFTPIAGSVVTIGYTTLGTVAALVKVDARELHASDGTAARGLVVEVYQSQYHQESAFVDPDEIDELIRGIDALLAVQTNPTAFQQFEVRYTTKGALQLAAFNGPAVRGIRFMIQAGRGVPAQTDVSEKDFRAFRALIVAAQEKLRAP